MTTSSAPKKLSVEVEFKAKPSLPIRPSPSPEGTTHTDIQPPEYAQEQHDTWRLLFERQEKLLKDRVCDEYIEGRKLIEFTRDRVPKLAEVSTKLKTYSGWEVIRVDGYVPEEIFFQILAQKRFPCTDFVRHPSEFEYTPAPDMFHDLMGHLPMFMHPRFASFFHSYGIAGTNVRGKEDVEALGRIYWYTVEFGLINPTAHLGAKRDPSKSRVYGAGIASSVGEIEHSLSDKVKKIPYDIDVIVNTTFDIHHMQDHVFEIASFEELESTFIAWARKRGLLT